MPPGNSSIKSKAAPFSLSAFIILADQLVKNFIVTHWPRIGSFITDVFNNDILWIIHVRNKAVAFSLGHNLPERFRPLVFIVLPLAVLVFLVAYYFKTDELNGPQRWALAGILGGGIGNIIDRIFRPDGVVDFISVKFYGILGYDRWPTFNIADAGVVISVFLFLFTIIFDLKTTGQPGKPRG